jgi:hypothetical protein
MSQLLVGRKQFAYESLTSSVVAVLEGSTPVIAKPDIGHDPEPVSPNPVPPKIHLSRIKFQHVRCSNGVDLYNV